MGFLGAYTHGSTVVFPFQTFEADAVLDAVAAERCTAILGVPTMFVAELEAMSRKRRKLDSLKKALAAGSLVLPAVMRRMEQDMVRGEGLTQARRLSSDPVITSQRQYEQYERWSQTASQFNARDTMLTLTFCSAEHKGYHHRIRDDRNESSDIRH